MNSQPQYAASTAAAPYSSSDVAASARLLAAAGYTRFASGPYEDVSGRPLQLKMAVETGDPWTAELATLIAAQLDAAGIEVVVVPVDGAKGMSDAARANSYDMALVSRTASTFLTSTLAWYSAQLGLPGTDGSEDWSNFMDPTVDQLFRQASVELNPVKGATYYGQIDDELWNEMVALPLFQEPAFLAHGVQIGDRAVQPVEHRIALERQRLDRPEAEAGQIGGKLACAADQARWACATMPNARWTHSAPLVGVAE